MSGLIDYVIALTIAEMIIGIVMGKMSRGTVSWLKRASPENTAAGERLESLRKWNAARVTRVISADDVCVRNAGTKN